MYDSKDHRSENSTSNPQQGISEDAWEPFADEFDDEFGDELDEDMDDLDNML